MTATPTRLRPDAADRDPVADRERLVAEIRYYLRVAEKAGSVAVTEHRLRQWLEAIGGGWWPTRPWQS